MTDNTDNGNDLFACPKCKCPMTVSPSSAMSGLVCPFCNHRWRENDLTNEKTERGELIGWRGYNVVRLQGSGELRLESPVFPTGPWPTSIEGIKAECGGMTGGPCRHDPEGRSPGKGCGCGFYAGRTRAHLLSLGYGNYAHRAVPTVMGQVAMWGRVVLASNGYRAEYVRPLTIEVPFAQMGGLDTLGLTYSWELAKELEGVYPECEIVLENTLVMPETNEPRWCHKCGSKMKSRQPQCPFCGTLND